MFVTFITSMSMTRGSVTCLFLSNISLTFSRPWRAEISSWNVWTETNKETKKQTRHITNSFHSLDNNIFQIFEYKQGWKHHQWVCACIRVRAYMSNFTLCCVLCCLYVVMSVCLWPWRGMRCGIRCERVSYLCSAPRGTRPGTALELSVWPPAGRGWRSV